MMYFLLQFLSMHNTFIFVELLNNTLFYLLLMYFNLIKLS
jgi:hypothetical protein